MSKWKDIGTLLLEYGLIGAQDLKEGIRLQKEAGLRLGEALVKLGKVTMEDIEWILSKQLDIPFVIVEDVTANIELLEKFQKDFLIENRILPLYETDENISVVMEDPFNESAMDRIVDLFGKNVTISIGSGSKIERLLKQVFNKSGLPDLVTTIKDTIEKIRRTSFYRMDFLLAEYACIINAFGCGILKQMGTIKGHFSNEDVFRAFGDLGIKFLYEQSFSSNRRFVAVYPLVNETGVDTFPAIIGEYGLYCPEDTTFTDAHVYGVPQIFPLERPVGGYPCIVTHYNNEEYDNSVYVFDAAPKRFKDHYVRIYVPRICTSCAGLGCVSCRDLGHVFSKIEGIYSSSDLNEKLKEE
jgi:hypothetical protein